MITEILNSLFENNSIVKFEIKVNKAPMKIIRVISYFDTGKVIRNLYVEIKNNEDLISSYSYKDKRERNSLILNLYKNKLTQMEIAEFLSISQSLVSNIISSEGKED